MFNFHRLPLLCFVACGSGSRAGRAGFTVHSMAFHIEHPDYAWVSCFYKARDPKLLSMAGEFNSLCLAI